MRFFRMGYILYTILNILQVDAKIKSGNDHFYSFYIPSTIQITKKATPKTIVSLVINNSPPRSLRFANNASLPPVKACEALSAFPLCKSAMAINKIEITIKAISTRVPSFFHYILIYHISHVLARTIEIPSIRIREKHKMKSTKKPIYLSLRAVNNINITSK